MMLSPSLLRKTTLVLIVIGLLDSIYLSWIKLTNQEAYCAGIGDCDVVNTSEYSEIAGIPIAILGTSFYFLMLILVIIEGRTHFWKNNSPLFVFGLSLGGTIYSGYLTYIEMAVIYAICPYCVLSAVATLFIFILSMFRLKQGLGELE
jgi:uncharacterized membrane protein